MNNRFARTSLLVLAVLILVPVVAFAEGAAPDPGVKLSAWILNQIKPLMAVAFGIAALVAGFQGKFTKLIGLAFLMGLVGLFIYEPDIIRNAASAIAKLGF